MSKKLAPRAGRQVASIHELPRRGLPRRGLLGNSYTGQCIKSGQIRLEAWPFPPLYSKCQPQHLVAADKYALWCQALMGRALRTMGILRLVVSQTKVCETAVLVAPVSEKTPSRLLVNKGSPGTARKLTLQAGRDLRSPSRCRPLPSA